MTVVCLAPRADKTVVVLGTGGTIAGRAASRDDHVGYAAGEVGVEQLLAGVPDLVAWRLEAEQVAQVDSKDMGLALWLRLLARARHHLARPEVAGVVVTHGTDTLEETAYFLHSLLATDKPVVLTAAMRPATALVPDGPQNLLDAVALAGTDCVSGVVCVVAGQVMSATDVCKTHTYRTDAFSSGDAGPLGWVEAGQWRPLRANGAGGQWAQLALPDAALWPRVEVVFSHAGQDGAVVRALMASPTERPAGWVVAGTGNGTIHHELVRALQQAQAMGCRVLRTTRCAEGRVLGEHGDWPVTPVTSPYKARIGLMLELLAAPDAAAPGLERPHMPA